MPCFYSQIYLSQPKLCLNVLSTKSENLIHIFSCNFRHLIKCYFSKFGNKLGYISDIHWLVPLAPVRNRCHIRRICFKQKLFKWHRFHYFFCFFRVLKSQCTTKTKIITSIQTLSCFLYTS